MVHLNFVKILLSVGRATKRSEIQDWKQFLNWGIFMFCNRTWRFLKEMITDNFKRERYNGRTKVIWKKERFLLFPLTLFFIFYLDFIPQTLTRSGKPWYLMNQVETGPQGTGISSIFVNTVKNNNNNNGENFQWKRRDDELLFYLL